MSEDDLDPAIYWEERLRRFDLSSVGYRALGLRYNQWLYRVRSSVFRRALRRTRFDCSAASVLDVGSGTGFYVEEWLRAGTRAVTASDMTAVATENLRVRFASANVARFDVTDGLPFRARSFDAVSAFDVLFHIVSDQLYEQAIANVASLLRPGGFFFFSENFVHGPTVRIGHQASRSLAEIEKLLERHDLQPVLRRPMFVLMNAPADSESRVAQGAWRLLAGLVSRHEAIGALVGGALYPLELGLVHMLRESASTELMVCRRLPISPEDDSGPT